jgi:hypothetical protein
MPLSVHHRLVVGLALAAVAAVVAWGLWFRAAPIDTPEPRGHVHEEQARVALEAPVRAGRPSPGSVPGPAGAGVVLAGPLPPEALPPEPPDPAARYLPFRLQVVDATDGRGIAVPWKLKLARGASWVDVTSAEPTVDFLEEKGLLAVAVVPAPTGFVAWDEALLETKVARRATALWHVYPLRPEAAVELSVSDPRGRPLPGTGVSARVAGRSVAVQWAGGASGRIGGVPFLREEEVELSVRLSDAAKGEHADWLGWIDWRGRLATHRGEVLRAEVVLPAFEGPASSTLIGVGGGAGGAFRGRGRRRLPEDTGRVEVAVVGRDGQPLANTRVNLGGRSSATDARGIVVFEDVTPGEREVNTQEPGVATTRATVTVASRRTSRITLRESEGGTLDVEVVDEAGVGLPFAAVGIGDSTWLDVADDGTQRTDPYTDELGRRSFAHVSAGGVVVRAEFGERTAQESVEVRDRERTVVRLVVK